MFGQPVFDDKIPRAEVRESLCWTISMIALKCEILSGFERKTVISPDAVTSLLLTKLSLDLPAI